MCFASLYLTFHYFQVAEKVILPSAEDLKQEKTHESLIKGIEQATPDKLQHVQTRVSATPTERKC